MTFEYWVIPLWFVEGLICAWLAKRSNRDRMQWFGAGILLGPLALAIILFKIVVLDKPEVEERGKPKQWLNGPGTIIVSEDEKESSEEK